MTALPGIGVADKDSTADASATANRSVVKQVVGRFWWVACLLPALVLLGVATGR